MTTTTKHTAEKHIVGAQLISGSTCVNDGNPIDCEATVKVVGRGIHHSSLPGFIVTAVNSHQALLDACKEALLALTTYRMLEAAKFGMTLADADEKAGQHPAITQLQAAIALVEKGME